VQVFAIDSNTGAMRWTTTFDFPFIFTPNGPATHFGLFVDPTGMVVVTAGAVRGLDLGTGSTVWTLHPPNANVCLQPAVLGVGGSILAAQCDGTVFLARDP
jgi:outer membrane protein assembly factor BamB